MSEKPPPTPSQYFLKTAPIKVEASPAPLSSSSTDGQISTSREGLYLRLHGDGVTSVVLTPTQPMFLRWEHTDLNQEIATSWKHPGRTFGLVMGTSRPNYAWEEAQIVENEGDGGFEWQKEDGREVLVWKKGGEFEAGGEKQKGNFHGWMACPWVHGHPQLFWVTGMVEKVKELPPCCTKVAIVREWLIPRE